MISHKPAYVEAELSSKSESNIDNLILEYQRLERIKIDRDAKTVTSGLFKEGNLYQQLQTYAKGYSNNEEGLPAGRALRALISGIERTPYRVPIEEAQPQPSYY